MAGTTHPVAAPVSGNSTLRAAVEALFRHRRAFLATAATVLVATLLITFLTPRTYVSEMNILVRNARPDLQLSPERSNGPVVQREVTEERINSEIEVLRSKDVADEVVDPGWAQMPMASQTDEHVKTHEKAVLAYAKHLAIDPMRKSNVIHVSYVAASPREATDTVERLLKAFLAKQREIERSTGASTFFASESARYKAELDAAQQALAGFQQSNQIVSLPAKETTLETQITSLEDAIRSTQVQITEAAERVASDKHELALLPPRLATQQRSIPNTQAVEQLTAILVNYQNQRTHLLERFLPTDRLVTEVETQIATTSAALAKARTTNGEESTTDLNPVFQQVKAMLASSITDLAALRGRLADLTAQHVRLRQRLVDVEGSTVDYTTLETRVAELRGNYQLYSQKKNEAEIADAMDQQQLVNVAVAERPTFTARPYRPQVLVNLLLGAFTAIFFGLCAVFFAELGRDTIAAPYELEAMSSVPVLATIPYLASSSSDYFGGGMSPAGRRGPTTGDGGQPARPADQPPVLPSGGTPATAKGADLMMAPMIESPVQVIAVEISMPPTLRLDRKRPLTYEQLAAARVVATPAQPAEPASPVAETVPEIATGEVRETRHRAMTLEGEAQLRPRLSPSQRVQGRRPIVTRDREGRLAYVTYTVNPR